MTIWKFPLAVAVMMPRGARVLTVQVQNNEPMLWAVVDPREPLERRGFAIHGTGHDAPPNADWLYISTFQILEGTFVFHVFQEPTP